MRRTVDASQRARPGYRQRRLVAMIWLGALSLTLMLGLAPPAPTNAAGPWSPPLRISGDTGGPWFPDIAADDQGTVHVVWNGYYVEGSRYEIGALYYTRGDQQGWTRPNDLAVIWKGHALRSAVAVGGSGRIHLLYKGLGDLTPDSLLGGGGLGQEELWHMSAPGRRAETINAWSAPEQVNAGTQAYFSDLAIDSRGVLHAIFTEPIDTRWEIYYRRSTDGGATWSRRLALDWGRFAWWYRAHLRIDAQDRLHVAWEVTDRDSLGVTLGAAYAISTDGGETWATTRFEPPKPAATSEDRPEPPKPGGDRPEPLKPGPQQPAIGIDGWGRVLLIYREPETYRILYRLSHGGTDWGPALPLPGVSRGLYRPYDVYETITDSAGHVHLIITAYPTGSEWLSLLHSVWDGRGWSAPTVITSAAPTPDYAPYTPEPRGEPQVRPLLSPPYPEYPRLALSNGNRLHLVWFGGDRPSIDREPLGIWYSTALTGAPAVTGTAAPATGEVVRPRSAAVGPELTPAARSAAPAPTPSVGSIASLNEARSPDVRRWQEYPLMLGGGLVALVLLAVLTMRLRPFDRSGR